MDEEALMRASEQVVGKHDFTSFAASDPERNARIAEGAEEEKDRAPFWPSVGQGGAAAADESSRFGSVTNVRTIHSSQWARTSEELIYTVRGDGFLHHMVRNLVGTFLLVGKGSLRISNVPTILEARNRSAAGPTSAACGLYLVSVEY
jgi:tRNA pseudouridine38-40 synthase